MRFSLGLLGLAALARGLKPEHNTTTQPDNTYEYIVVGSGPGGGPLAANLARHGHSVLLIEAGDEQFNNSNSYLTFNNTPAINDPLTRWDFFVTRDTPEYDDQYSFLTWRQTNGEFYVGLDPPEGAERLGIYYPRAATVGGCAMHNAASISVPANVDWDDIADLTGDDTWRAENSRQYLVNLERCHYLPNGSTPDHGFNGYIDTSAADASWSLNASDLTTIAQGFADALGGRDTGLSLYEQLNRDINSNAPDRDQTDGVFTPYTHSDNGVRSSPRQYIRATLDDPRNFPLTLQTETLVTKIVFSDRVESESQEQEEPRAIGVEYLQGRSLYSADPRHDPAAQGTPGRAFASRDVIIAGGVYNTPQILKLSGIGPAEELAQFNIPVVKDLPGVGVNLKDNLETVLYGQFETQVTGFFDAFYTSSVAERTRDIHFYCGSMNFLGFFPGMPGWNPREFQCGFMQLHPRNINGTVKLRSADPRDVPAIHLGFFEEGDDDDLVSMTDAINFVRPIFNSLPKNPFTEIYPCNASVECTDEFQMNWHRREAHGHHAAGTAAIGADDDPLAVLDSKFRVRGVRGLRVVDASAWPVMPGELPALPTFMLSEKATETILKKLGESYP